MMMAINGRSGGGAGGGSGCRFPFTASQWQELEHQALIFKYMASGHPIPSDLILPIRRSVFLDSASPQASFFPHQPNVGWGCFQMGFGRKAEDPEPGRCRRTDGKKWRCSKEAHPDSKYCERHMHRGKNRSRKPVEMSLNATGGGGGGGGGSASSSSSSSASTTTSSAYAASLYAPPATHVPLSIFAQDGQQHHAAGVYPYSSVSSAYSRPSAAQFHLDPASPSADRDYRYFHGLKDDVDPFGCFPESNGGGRDASWRFTPLGLGDPKPRGCSFLQQDGGADDDKQQHQQQHCFVLGADLKTEKPSGKGEEEESQRTLRHFFDEWPLKSKESSWIGLEDEEQQQQHRPTSWSSSSSSFSKTQLSISTPMAAHNDLSLQW